jgi:hypothetical protein
MQTSTPTPGAVRLILGETDGSHSSREFTENEKVESGRPPDRWQVPTLTGLPLRAPMLLSVGSNAHRTTRAWGMHFGC